MKRWIRSIFGLFLFFAISHGSQASPFLTIYDAHYDRSDFQLSIQGQGPHVCDGQQCPPLSIHRVVDIGHFSATSIQFLDLLGSYGYSASAHIDLGTTPGTLVFISYKIPSLTKPISVTVYRDGLHAHASLILNSKDHYAIPFRSFLGRGPWQSIPLEGPMLESGLLHDVLKTKTIRPNMSDASAFLGSPEVTMTGFWNPNGSLNLVSLKIEPEDSPHFVDIQDSSNFMGGPSSFQGTRLILVTGILKKALYFPENPRNRASYYYVDAPDGKIHQVQSNHPQLLESLLGRRVVFRGSDYNTGVYTREDKPYVSDELAKETEPACWTALVKGPSLPSNTTFP